MATHQFQVNSPWSAEGVGLLPGNYSGQIHRRSDESFGINGEPVSYTLYIGPAVTSAASVSAEVKIVDVTNLVETGEITIIN